MFTQYNFNELEIGDEIMFGKLWDGEGDGESLLKSGAYAYDENHIVYFELYYRVRRYDLTDEESLLGARIIITDKIEYEVRKRNESSICRKWSAATTI